MKHRAAALSVSLALLSSANADPLPRRLDFGWTLGEPTTGGIGVEVKRIARGGGADRAGVHAGDVVLQVAEISATSDQGIAAFRFAGNPRQPVNVQLLRGPEHLAVRVVPLAAVRESHPGIDTEWGTVIGPGGRRLRTILTLAPGTAPRPAVFIVGWLSCDSVEISPERPDSTALLIRDIVEHSDGAVFRLDKPGVGDSEGVCSTTDFSTELESYRRAFAVLRADA
jgi:hypothetical protein